MGPPVEPSGVGTPDLGWQQSGRRGRAAAARTSTTPAETLAGTQVSPRQEGLNGVWAAPRPPGEDCWLLRNGRGRGGGWGGGVVTDICDCGARGGGLDRWLDMKETTAPQERGIYQHLRVIRDRTRTAAAATWLDMAI